MTSGKDLNIRELQNLSNRELGKLFPIVMAEPDPDWPMAFEMERSQLLGLLGENLARKIEHVGSTSVPGLLAKPTIDIILDIPAGPRPKKEIIPMLTSSGYIHMHQQENHIMMVKGYTPRGMEVPSYHIHLGSFHQKELKEMQIFRDILRSDAETAGAYARLKTGLAQRYKHDREGYTQAKTDFIKRALKGHGHPNP